MRIRTLLLLTALLNALLVCAQVPIQRRTPWFVGHNVANPLCTPNIPPGAVAYYDVLCPASVILNSTNTVLGKAVLTWKNLTGDPKFDITNNILDYINLNPNTTFLTGAVYHASGSLNSNSTPNIFFDRQYTANGSIELDESLETGAGTNVPQPFTFLMVFQEFAYTNGNIVVPIAQFNGNLHTTQRSVSLNTTPNGRIQVYHGGAGSFFGGFTWGTNWTIMTCVLNGVNSYIRTNGSLYVYGDGGTTNFIATNVVFTLGGNPTVSWTAMGRFGVWNRELTTNELQWIETNSYVFLK